MAQGSQQPSRGGGNPDEDWFGGRETCTGCGKKLTLKNFWHVRTRYPGQIREVFCSDCGEQIVRDNIEMHQESLGLLGDPF